MCLVKTRLFASTLLMCRVERERPQPIVVEAKIKTPCSAEIVRLIKELAVRAACMGVWREEGGMDWCGWAMSGAAPEDKSQLTTYGWMIVDAPLRHTQLDPPSLLDDRLWVSGPW